MQYPLTNYIQGLLLLLHAYRKIGHRLYMLNRINALLDTILGLGHRHKIQVRKTLKSYNGEVHWCVNPSSSKIPENSFLLRTIYTHPPQHSHTPFLTELISNQLYLYSLSKQKQTNKQTNTSTKPTNKVVSLLAFRELSV